MKIALGTAQFGFPYGVANNSGQISLQKGKLLLDQAFENGITTLDTAIAYGNSEQRLGQIGVEGWKVISKLPGVPDGCESVSDWVFEQLHDSLGRLGVSRLYGLLLHRPHQLLEPNGFLIYESLKRLKDDGLVQKIGVSIYDPSELDALFEVFDLDLIQTPFNILDRRILKSGWLDRLSNVGIEIHTRSAFLQGLLLMNRAKKFAKWSTLWNEWFSWLESSGLSALEACLLYPLSFSQISKVVIGVDNSAQLIQIILATKGSISSFPEHLGLEDIDLLNPANWPRLS